MPTVQARPGSDFGDLDDDWAIFGMVDGRKLREAPVLGASLVRLAGPPQQGRVFPLPGKLTIGPCVLKRIPATSLPMHSVGHFLARLPAFKRLEISISFGPTRRLVDP